VGTGWASEKVYRMFTEVNMRENLPKLVVKLPNGKVFEMHRSCGLPIQGNSAEDVETTKQHNEEMKKLIAEKKYEFLKTGKNSEGDVDYSYRFTFADGSQNTQSFDMRLENITSWDDYHQKCDERLQKAIAAGKFRLVDAKPVLSHICHDVGTQEKYNVLYLPRPNSDDVAYITPAAAEGDGNGPEYVPLSYRETTWQEHLAAVREGKREILDVKNLVRYFYEITLEDGSKTIFTYGGPSLTEQEENKK
jgi:hypothetical protein